jgi:hypothetical protein
VEISRELQEARDSEAEARMLHRQRVQMIHRFSARIMEAVHRLGIHGLNLPTIPECRELIDAECRELLGLAGMRIFSNLQCPCPDLDLEEVL